MSGKKESPKTGELIDFNNPAEVRHWMKKLQCSRNELLYAIEALGNSAQAIRDSLEERPKGQPFTRSQSDELQPNLSPHFLKPPSIGSAGLGEASLA